MPAVLVVSDDPTTRSRLEKLLEGAGYAVECLDNGAAGIARAAAGGTDLVLLDLTLPDA
jgi:CheY-like chemotaxis protein